MTHHPPGDRPQSSRKELMQNLALLAGATFVALLLAEALLRVFNVWTGVIPLPAQLYQKTENPILQYELRPNEKIGLYVTNAHGFRDEPFPVPKPPGTYRILFIGDSIVYGLWVKIENSVTHNLEEILTASGGGRRFEVCNLGVSGYNTEQEIETLRTKGLALEPDLVVLGWFINDLVEASAELGVLRRFDEVRREGPSASSFVYRWSRLAGFLRFRVLGRKSNWGQALAERLRPHGDVHTQVSHQLEGLTRDAQSARELYGKVPEQLTELRDMSRSAGAGFAFVIMPVLCDWENYPFLDLHAQLLATCDSLGIPGLDLYPTYRTRPLEEISTGDACHPSALGHRMAAEAIAEFLWGSGALDSRAGTGGGAGSGAGESSGAARDPGPARPAEAQGR